MDNDLCEGCGSENVQEDHLCNDCIIERAQDKREAYIEAMS